MRKGKRLNPERLGIQGECGNRVQENSFSYRLKIEYSIQNGKAKIVRCWGAYEEISLPPVLEGCPVTEIGPYAFSPAFSMERDAGDTELHTIWTGTPGFGGEEAPGRIAGDSLLGVQLPDSLEAVSYTHLDVYKRQPIDGLVGIANYK